MYILFYSYRNFDDGYFGASSHTFATKEEAEEKLLAFLVDAYNESYGQDGELVNDVDQFDNSLDYEFSNKEEETYSFTQLVTLGNINHDFYIMEVRPGLDFVHELT